MQDRHLCFPPYFYLGPAVAPTYIILESPLQIWPAGRYLPITGILH